MDRHVPGGARRVGGGVQDDVALSHGQGRIILLSLLSSTWTRWTDIIITISLISTSTGLNNIIIIITILLLYDFYSHEQGGQGGRHELAVKQYQELTS